MGFFAGAGIWVYANFCGGAEVGLTANGFAFGELLGKAPQVTKGACSWLGPSSVGIPSLRRCSVGPRRTDIHVLTALSPHPCGSTHCASSAFGLHPSRDGRCLDFLRMKIKSRSKASRLKLVLRARALLLVGPASAGKGPVWTTAISRPDTLIVPTFRVGMHPVTLRVTTRDVHAFGRWRRSHGSNWPLRLSPLSVFKG